MKIESIHNPKIKYAVRLQEDNRFRKREDVFVVEGRQEVSRALQFGYELQELFVQPDIFPDHAQVLGSTAFNEVEKSVYNKMAYRKDAEGIIGIFKKPITALEDYQWPENGKMIIVEGLEKPGNLGAILRSCEAFGIDAVVLADAKVDLYHPNVIRSSVGCLFGMSVFTETKEMIITYLNDKKIPLFLTHLHSDAKSLRGSDFSNGGAVLFGTEHSGITDFWLDKGQNIVIPMQGTIDSLNLSNAVAITCYEMSK